MMQVQLILIGLELQSDFEKDNLVSLNHKLVGVIPYFFVAARFLSKPNKKSKL